MLPIVAIVGRTNVGKSTLFNRLIGRRLAIVDKIPGVTRDRMYADASWPFGRFTVIDTGGWDQADPEMQELVDEQRLVALREADLVLFVVDSMSGMLPEDLEIAERLRQMDLPLLIIANKADNEKLETAATEFYDLGLNAEVLPLSVKGKRNWGKLLDEIESHVGNVKDDKLEGPFPLAIIGRPNAGKSSLVNAMVGEERLITSAVPGTTRDAVGVPFRFGQREYMLIDTAGLRRKSKVRGEILERLTVVRALEHIRRSRLVLMMIDVNQGIVDQDEKILGYALEQGRACVLVYNKCDSLVLSRTVKRELIEQARYRVKFAAHLPVVFTSATEGLGLRLLMQEVERLAEAYSRRLSTAELNKVMERAENLHQPPLYRGHEVRLRYATQVEDSPPKIIIFLNREAKLHFSYRRFIENQLRKAGKWNGVPLRVEYKMRDSRFKDSDD
jgi:GTP-binding protein